MSRVDHPVHYGGKDNPYEVIKVLQAWLTPEEFRGFCKGNVIKYHARTKDDPIEDAAKAAWYDACLTEFNKEVAAARASDKMPPPAMWDARTFDKYHAKQKEGTVENAHSLKTPNVPEAKVIADSVGEHSPRLTTMLVRMPRCVLAEFNTHRVFTRNAASSRAIPVPRMIEQVMEDPFIPLVWGKNAKGMQSWRHHDAQVELFDRDGLSDAFSNEEAWLFARNKAVEFAMAFAKAGYHKQIVNRLLEPWMWTLVCVTSTDWGNFFALRRHEGAEPHIRLLADAMFEALQLSSPRKMIPGEWHLPFVGSDDWEMIREFYPYSGDTPANITQRRQDAAIKLSVARCASTSYKTVDGFDMTIERATELHDKLVGAQPMHASPAEHQATPDDCGTYSGRKKVVVWSKPGLGGNLGNGWIQYRKTLPGENSQTVDQVKLAV
jgi:hypothetical protein